MTGLDTAAAPAPLLTGADLAAARWRAFCDLAVRCAGAPGSAPDALAAEREAIRNLTLPETAGAAAAMRLLTGQADLYTAAGPRQREAFAPALKALAEQAWSLTYPAPVEDPRLPEGG